MIIFFKLILAHLLADFVFQTDKAVKSKEKKKIRSVFLYLHVLLHGVLSMLFVWDRHFLKYALVIVVTHFFIDLGKIYLNKRKSQRLLFFTDQALHIAVLGLVGYAHQQPDLNFQWIFIEKNIVFITALVFLTKPASVIIKMFISRWAPVNQKDDSLQNAGNWIGMLERLLIFGFILSGKWEAIGFLLAAKSVFRFGDLKDNKDRKLTEYILIGTLISFGIAILAGIVYLELIQVI